MANQTQDGINATIGAGAHVVRYLSQKYPSEESGVTYEVDYDQTDANSEVTPNEEEQHTLRRIADSIPLVAWLLILVEFCERFSWYG